MVDVKSSTLRRVSLELLVGLALGFLLASLIGPAAISRWYAPPSADAFSCAGTVEKALAQFVTLQLICAGVGALAFVVVLVFVRRLFRKAPSPTT